MNISGFQKLSLVDYPEKVAAIVFTQGCAFTCRYCHNPELICFKKKGDIAQEEVLAYLETKKYFIDGLVITGGEPTLQKDLIDFAKQVKEMGLLVKLDTSGVNPYMVKECIEESIVDFFSMDLKHVWEKYDKVTQVSNTAFVDKVRETMHIIQDSGINHEFRTTVFPKVHEREDFTTMASYLLPGESYYLQQIRYVKVLDPSIKTDKILSVSDIAKDLEKIFPLLHIGYRE